MVNQANVGRPWTPAEDKLLCDAVDIHGHNTEKWKTIALSVPGRTNKACRKRWLHSLSPTVKKSAWTAEEDAKLLALFDKHPHKWSKIAREIPGRTDDACSKRYREALDPNLKKDDWTEDEERKLAECYVNLGGKWGAIGLELNRSGLGCRNRWRLMERRKNVVPLPVEPSEAHELSSGVPQVVADAWPSFSSSSSASYWNMIQEGWNLPVHAVFQHESAQSLDHSVGHWPSEGIAGFGSSASTVNVPEVPSAQRTSTEDVPFSFASSSLSTALAETSEARSARLANGNITCPEPNPPPRSPPNTNEEIGGGSDDEPFDMDTDLNFENGQEETDNGVEETRCTPDASHDSSTTGGNNDAETINIELAEGSLHEDSSSTTVPEIPCQQETATGNDTVVTGSHAADDRDSSVSPPQPPQSTGQYVTERPSDFEVHVDLVIDAASRKHPRLSSTLPVASDSTILAYACGSDACWDANFGRYATSGELINHYKAEHALDLCERDATPFRCGLQDCNKGWKSVNGLQYHLQISKAHFSRIISSAVAQKGTTTTKSARSLQPNGKPKKQRKMHDCPVTDCPNSYRQLSGLRYHLQHGHPQNLPAQLDAVPPELARRLGIEPLTPFTTPTLPASQ